MNKSRFFDVIVGLFFALCVIGIYVTNLQGNFYLTGWDNLHPEFDYKTNISRAFFSSWQEYQGVGLPAGNAHATELIKEVILKNLSFLIPIQDERKFFFLLMLWIGPLGVYFMLKKIFFRERQLHEKTILGTIGGIIYLFHIATVQIFYTPYESFAAHYALLPWMIFSLFFYLQNRSKKNLLFVFLIHLLGSTQFYIPTLFIVYCMVSFLIILFTLIHQRNIKELIKHGIVLGLCVIIANSYWLFSFLNYTASNIHSQLSSYNNLMYSEDIYLANFKSSGLKNIILFKGFMIDYLGTINNKSDYMMAPWRNYIESPLFALSRLGFLALVIVGLLYSIRKRGALSIGILFVLFFSLIAMDVFPFSLLNELLRKNALFHQVFRNPFTKFANTLLLLESLLFTFGLDWIISQLVTKGKLYKKHVLLCFLVFIFLVQNMSLFPIWQGYFIYPALKKNIPKEYFDLFTYFTDKGDGRIANLPQTTNNGWYTYEWGYLGSGFLWYGIKQPILDRSFDVWHKDNENYYWEVQQAIYATDVKALKNVFDKYQVRWVIADGNILNPGPIRSSYLDKTLSLFDESGWAVLRATFGKIKVYEMIGASQTNKYIQITNNLPHISPLYSWNNVDQAYADYGYYESGDKASFDKSNKAFYPFRSLFTGRSQKELEFQIDEENKYYSFQKIGFNTNSDSYIDLPALDDNDKTNLPSLFINSNMLSYSASQSSMIKLDSKNNNIFEVRIPKVDGIFSQHIFPFDTLLNTQAKSCNPFNDGLKKIDVSNEDKTVRITSRKSSNCFAFDLFQLSHRYAYLISIKNKNINGRGLLFSVRNKTSRRIDLEEYLPQNKESNTSWFILAPKEQYGLGYYLEFDNISLTLSDTTINELGDINIQPIPLSFLSKIKIIRGQSSRDEINKQKNTYVTNIYHYDPNVYWLERTSSTTITNNEVLILSQSFHTGWSAYIIPQATQPSHLMSYLAPFIGKKAENHILINNWANGWIVPPGETQIVIIFLPQYLQFVGFGVILIALLFLFLFPITVGHLTKNTIPSK